MRKGKQLHLLILSTGGNLFEGDADSVTLPGVCGSFTVLPRHAALVASLEAGNVVYAQSGERVSIPIQSGVVEVRADEVSVCVVQPIVKE